MSPSQALNGAASQSDCMRLLADQISSAVSPLANRSKHALEQLSTQARDLMTPDPSGRPGVAVWQDMLALLVDGPTTPAQTELHAAVQNLWGNGDVNGLEELLTARGVVGASRDGLVKNLGSYGSTFAMGRTLSGTSARSYVPLSPSPSPAASTSTRTGW